MLLCHLLIEREAAEDDFLLDHYLTSFYFPWSSTINDRDDTFYLQANVVDRVRQALDYLRQNGTRITATAWLGRNQPAPLPAPCLAPPIISTQPALDVETFMEVSHPVRQRGCTDSESPSPPRRHSKSSSLPTLPKRRRTTGAGRSSAQSKRV